MAGSGGSAGGGGSTAGSGGGRRGSGSSANGGVGVDGSGSIASSGGAGSGGGDSSGGGASSGADRGAGRSSGGSPSVGGDCIIAGGGSGSSGSGGGGGDGSGGKARYVLDEQIGYLLRLAAQRHAALFQARAVEGLTPTQFAALIRLSQHEAVSQNHLGRLTGMDGATIKGVVDRLKAKGLVTLSPDPDDRRRTLISLSARGRLLVPALEAMGTEVTAATFAPLTTAEARALKRLIEKLT